MDRNLRLLGVGAAIRTFGNALYAPFLALFLHNVLGVGYVEIGLIIAAIGIVQLPANYAGGLLTDRLGRRSLILYGLVAECLTTAGLAYTFALKSLEGAIIVAFIGVSIISITSPAISAYVADLAVGSERTRGFTFYRIGFNAGFAAGVAVGGLLISYIGFAGSVAAAAGIIGAGAAFLALTLEPSPKDLELRAQRGRPTPTDQPEPPASPRRGLADSFRILARDRVALELLLAFALGGLVVGQWGVTFPLFVNNILGIPYALLGIGLALNGVLVVVAQHWTTESVIGRRHTTIAIGGLALYVLAFLGLGISAAIALFPIAVFFVAVLVITMGENLISIPAATLPSNVAPPEELGSYNGAFQFAAGAGGLIAVLFGGVVLASTQNALLIWIYLVLPAVPAVLLFRHAARRLPASVDRA